MFSSDALEREQSDSRVVCLLALSGLDSSPAQPTGPMMSIAKGAREHSRGLADQVAGDVLSRRTTGRLKAAMLARIPRFVFFLGAHPGTWWRLYETVSQV